MKARPVKPPLRLQTTTLWEYPSQHYGVTMQGSQQYAGATPSYVIWNLLQRYTEPGQRVVDPMCGSGTTLDVAADLARQARGFDLAPARADVECADARALPLPDASVDFVFIDPPYGDHLHYSDDAGCIGELAATGEPYFEALAAVFGEAWRILRQGAHMGLYVCDFFHKRRGFVPIGARVVYQLAGQFSLVDHVAVVRHNKSLARGNWHQAAEAGNFFLRGFNHLIIVRKG